MKLVETALMRQCRRLRGAPPHRNRPGSQRAAVLIEPRKFHLLEARSPPRPLRVEPERCWCWQAVVRNVMHFAGEEARTRPNPRMLLC